MSFIIAVWAKLNGRGTAGRPPSTSVPSNAILEPGTGEAITEPVTGDFITEP